MQKTLVLIAHDNKKPAMVQWARRHHACLSRHKIHSTHTTGQLLQEGAGLKVECLLSGPLGGDAQVGALVASKQISAVIFFVDPLTAMPHDPDIKMLMRICDVHNVPLATNPATAECILRSHLLEEGPLILPGSPRPRGA